MTSALEKWQKYFLSLLKFHFLLKFFFSFVNFWTTLFLKSRNKDATLKLISSHCASIWCSTQYNNLGCYKSIESENEIWTPIRSSPNWAMPAATVYELDCKTLAILFSKVFMKYIWLKTSPKLIFYTVRITPCASSI